MTERTDWDDLRDRRLSEPGAAEAHDAARLAFELGRAVRQMRESRGWSQSELARAADMTRSAVARFEGGGTVPTLPVLERLARALDANWRCESFHVLPQPEPDLSREMKCDHQQHQTGPPPGRPDLYLVNSYAARVKAEAVMTGAAPYA
ncbi:helix-turn-helix domain-containing protein [Nonomuraea angiospora]|uniref:helix-turn-helix domain-containing protein n=1 Tax=Nonomuraea angiospora TaxID=46172 RepID=UPI0029C9D8D1|nr:helix-turn-helix transcriptional regulator [Nonomuraea angiospora]